MKIFKYVWLTALLSVLLIVTACDTPQPPENENSLPPSQSVAPSESGTASEDISETENTSDTAPQASVRVSAVSLTVDGTEVSDITFFSEENRTVITLPLYLSRDSLKAVDAVLVTEDGKTVTVTNADFSEECTVILPDKNGEDAYCTVVCERESYNLPLLEIDTDGEAPIIEKNTYIHGVLTVDGEKYPMQIKGRGNASWNTFPKKAYRIKLDDGAPLLGLTKNRDWVLVSAYPDKTLIRNCVAHTIASSLSGIEYTPTHIPVNLYLNGEYLGVYTFADKIEEGKGRLDLGETVYDGNSVKDAGFLLEIGWDFDGENDYNRDYFDTDHVVRIYVKEPDVPVANTPEFLFLKYYVLAMEAAIVNDSGWENYIDVDAWVDWFIVNELTFNTESSFYRSCYLWRPVGGKVKMGPVWDFDMAFGNHYADLLGYDGWCTTESTFKYIPKDHWMNYLITYPAFTDRLVERWNEVKEELLITALSAVDEYSEKLKGSEEQNFMVWDIMTEQIGSASVDGKVYNTYEKQVQYLRDFINSRWKYMDNRLNSNEYDGIPDESEVSDESEASAETEN